MTNWIPTDPALGGRLPTKEDGNKTSGDDHGFVFAQRCTGEVAGVPWNSPFVKTNAIAWQPYPAPYVPPAPVETPRPPGWYCPKKDPPRECDASIDGHIQACTEKKRHTPKSFRWNVVAKEPNAFWWWHPMATEPIPVKEEKRERREFWVGQGYGHKAIYARNEPSFCSWQVKVREVLPGDPDIDGAKEVIEWLKRLEPEGLFVRIHHKDIENAVASMEGE